MLNFPIHDMFHNGTVKMRLFLVDLYDFAIVLEDFEI